MENCANIELWRRQAILGSFLKQLLEKCDNDRQKIKALENAMIRIVCQETSMDQFLDILSCINDHQTIICNHCLAIVLSGDELCQKCQNEICQDCINNSKIPGFQLPLSCCP